MDLVESQEQGGRIKYLQKEANSGEIPSYGFLLTGSSGGSSDRRVVAGHRQTIAERML